MTGDGRGLSGMVVEGRRGPGMIGDGLDWSGNVDSNGHKTRTYITPCQSHGCPTTALRLPYDCPTTALRLPCHVDDLE